MGYTDTLETSQIRQIAVKYVVVTEGMNGKDDYLACNIIKVKYTQYLLSNPFDMYVLLACSRRRLILTDTRPRLFSETIGITDFLLR